nr:hypothetical protein [Tanacetum cinerariifolium]
METTIEQQVAMDEALVPNAQRLRIRRSNFQLLSDIQSKESTLQLVYDVLRRCPFYKTFLVSRHQTTQQFGAMLPTELTNEEIRNSKAYKEYYAISIGKAAPKPRTSVKRTRGGSDTSITPPTAIATPRLTAAATLKLTATTKGKQTAKAPKAKSLSAPSEVAKIEVQQLKIVIKRSRQQTHISQPGGFGIDEGTSSKPGVPDVPTNESKEELSWNSSDDKGADYQEKESFDPIPQTPESSKDEGDGKEDQGLNIGEEERLNEEEEADELYRDQESSLVSSQFVTNMLNPTSDAGMESIFATALTSMAPFPITAQTMTPSTAVNEQLESEVLTRSSHSSRTSYAVAANLSEMKLKKILIEIMEGNKSIQHSDAQRNLYKALVEAYELDKIILDTYEETVTLKRRRDDDEDKDEEPSTRLDRGSKRRREGKEPESTNTPSEIATKSAGRSTTGSRSR